MERPGTSTSSFGVSRRENHDASSFYGRFIPPEISSDAAVAASRELDRVFCGDARDMSMVDSNSVALVVTSPPYFAGKEYEKALGEGGIPATYLEYLEMLREVFTECVRVLEPGGRIAVNVANLGRRPYRSLGSDIISILQDDLRLLLRGEIVWIKQRGASGSCAWGSFQRATNPVLRDLTERVIVASKGRFDRAVSTKERSKRGLPFESTMTREEFMEGTLDVWEIPPESATRVGHPAPFPVELPARLISLYTFKGDVVLDPFLGAGSTAVAAVQLDRHFLGFDLDPAYVALAEARVSEEIIGKDRALSVASGGVADNRVQEMIGEGRLALDIARELIGLAGFTLVAAQVHVAPSVTVAFRVRSSSGNDMLIDVIGGLTRDRPGLNRSELLWRALGQAAVIKSASASPLILLSSGLPDPKTPQHRALFSCVGEKGPLLSVVDVLDPRALSKLRVFNT